MGQELIVTQRVVESHLSLSPRLRSGLLQVDPMLPHVEQA